MAVAAQIRGESGALEWETYRVVLQRVMTLAAIASKAMVFASIATQGVEWRDDEWPEHKPDKFSLSADFESGLFWDAILKFRGRIPSSWATVRRIHDEMGRLTAKIARSESASAVRDMRAKLAALEKLMSGTFRVKGATIAQAEEVKRLVSVSIENKVVARKLNTARLSEFIRRAEVEGIIGATSARLETVYRTNVASAFNEATVDSMSGSDVARWAPLLQLVEIHDRRTRGAPDGEYSPKGGGKNPGFHWHMDGYIDTADGFRSSGLTPPNGYNCRGSLVPVTHDEAVEQGWVSQNGSLNRAAITRHNHRMQEIIDRGDYPDKGFKA